MRVLILDDERARHAEFARQYAGNEVHHAYDGEEFRRALQSRFHVIQFDHDLGITHENGNDIARWLTEQPPELWPSECVVHSWNPDGAKRIFLTLHHAGMRVRRELFSVKGPRQ